MGWWDIQMSVKTSYGFYEVFITKAFWVPRLFSWWVASGIEGIDGNAFLRVPRGLDKLPPHPAHNTSTYFIFGLCW